MVTNEDLEREQEFTTALVELLNQQQDAIDKTKNLVVEHQKLVINQITGMKHGK